jgi:hypothetical protein
MYRFCFHDFNCAANSLANAGPDIIICAGDNAVLTGTAVQFFNGARMKQSIQKCHASITTTYALIWVSDDRLYR